jgi:acetylornithine/N-succinyldiaminopimelate aminotransferase
LDSNLTLNKFNLSEVEVERLLDILMQNFEKIKSTEKQYIMPTYARFEVAIESGKGATATGIDATGVAKTYIDFGSGIGVNSLGYADDGWIKAVSEQAAKLAHISNLYYSPVQVQLAKLLCEKAGFSKVFFANSGAEANEGMIKLARKYSFEKYGKERATIVTLVNSFHGRTITTLAATGQEHFHNYFFPFTEGFKFAEANNIESLKDACTKDVCAIILEAVQGEGGVMPLDAGFVAKAAELAKQNDILLMFDEVQTGIGRTGKLFGFEHFGVKPDVISCAKGLAGGLPIGAVLCSEALDNVLATGMHGTTFGGNPICCAGAIEVLNRVANPEFLEEVCEKSEYIIDRLKKMPSVKNIRGKGLMLGFEINGTDSKKAAVELVGLGLLILTAKNVLRMLPPLVITKAEIDIGLNILEQYIGGITL